MTGTIIYRHRTNLFSRKILAANVCEAVTKQTMILPFRKSFSYTTSRILYLCFLASTHYEDGAGVDHDPPSRLVITA